LSRNLKEVRDAEYFKDNGKCARCQWLMPISLATQEAEIRTFEV
jgi:hypothetical protein